MNVVLFCALALSRSAAAQAPVEVATGAPVAVSTSGARAQIGPQEPPPSRALLRARALYFTSDVLKAAQAFEAAVKDSPRDAAAWRDGAVAWAEAGRPEKAVDWSRRAATLEPTAENELGLGWALLRADRSTEAAAAFEAALARDPDDAHAELGAGRAELALGQAAEAAVHFRLAAVDPLQQTLADFYLGRAEEALGDSEAAAAAYRRAVVADSYFNEGRAPLSREYVKLKRYDEAWRQLQRLYDAEPGRRLTRALLDGVRPMLSRAASAGAPASGPVAAPSSESESDAKIPKIRVGIGTTALGHPRARTSVTVRGAGAWRMFDAKGRTLAVAAAQESWTLRIVAAQGSGRHRKKARVVLRGPDGRERPAADTVLLKPDDAARGALRLEDDPNRGGSLGAGRSLRGDVEVALIDHRRGLRLVNVLDLEDYVQGVVGAEMPPNAPFEALKAQALVARTHALYIQKISKRHRRDGYDVCDGEHCQVYAGLRVESELTRAAVAQTRARVALYHGEIAHLIYSANCGGWAQSGRDIGWGDVPYWSRRSDSEVPQTPPDSPSALRRFLTTWPDAYCRPSEDNFPSHSRWARVVPAADLEEKLNRKSRIGKLKGLRVLRRDPTGHVEALLILGSRCNATLKDEYEIRGLLGVGSLRSTLFVVDTEYRRELPPAPKKRRGAAAKIASTLTPDAFVFRGGGWGHAVGMCQSGAIGRAFAGEDCETIVKAYFSGVALSRLHY
jgi:SpoIID/LytB domain protein